jgi:hypothetical protein
MLVELLRGMKELTKPCVVFNRQGGFSREKWLEYGYL